MPQAKAQTKVPTSFALDGRDKDRLRELAETRGTSQSETVRALLREAQAGPLPPPPNREELLALLGELARGGSVRAIELLLARQEKPSEGERPGESDAFSEVDEFSQRRRRAS